MAITIHGSSSWTDGGTTEDPYTSGSFTPPDGSKIYVNASAFAGSGDDNSKMVVSGTVLTWTQVPGAFLDQFTQGGSVAPPPIGWWVANGTGVAITVEQECVDGIGFSHLQGIWVLTDAGAVIDVGTFTGLGAASIDLTATAADQLAMFAMIDWSNSTDVPVKADPAMTTRKSGASGDVQSHLLADLFSTGAGTVTVGTQVLASPQGTNAVAILVEAGATSTNAMAGVATATATAHTPSTAIGVSAGAPNTTATAQGATDTVATGASTATATTAGLSATTTIATSAQAAVAAAAASNAQAAIGTSTTAASASAGALSPTAAIAVGAGFAPATASALNPTVLAGNVVYAFAGLAHVTATAWRPRAKELVHRPNLGVVQRPTMGVVYRP